MERRATATESTRQRIVKAAVDLYRQHGVQATSVGDVAARADVARTTVLNHFGDATGLMAAALESIEDSLQIPTAAIFDGSAGPGARVRRLTEALFALYDRSEPWYGALREELASVAALRRREERFWTAIQGLYDAALGTQRRNRRLRAALAGFTSPATFGALKGAGLSMAEAAQMVGDALAGMIAGA